MHSYAWKQKIEREINKHYVRYEMKIGRAFYSINIINKGLKMMAKTNLTILIYARVINLANYSASAN